MKTCKLSEKKESEEEENAMKNKNAIMLIGLLMAIWKKKKKVWLEECGIKREMTNPIIDKNEHVMKAFVEHFKWIYVQHLGFVLLQY